MGRRILIRDRRAKSSPGGFASGKGGSTLVALLCLAALLLVASAQAAVPLFQQVGSTLVMSNVNVRLEYNLTTGTTDFFWQNRRKLAGFYSGVTLDTGYVRGTTYGGRSWALVSSNQVVVTATNSALTPVTMKQYFVLDQDDSFLTRVEMSSTAVSAHWMGALVLDTPGGMDLGSYDDPRALFVPFDNDHFVRYNAEPLNGADTGHEVGAFYDNTTRHGLVVGSVTHDTWKTGVYWSGSSNKLDKLNVFGGVTSKWTWDVLSHGSVSGSRVSSPTVFVGFASDWREGLEAFAEANARFAPKLPWTNGVPFGWNSWGYYQSHLNYASALAVSDSIHTNLQPYGFANNGTVYVNLDSYWDNLSDAQLRAFADHCHASGQKAGIYWAPFAWWNAATNATNTLVEGSSSYHYSDVLLRNGSGGFQSNDSALAMDPTHPGTLQRMDYYVNRFLAAGFDYIKLDFLSHGALEGPHYDPAVTTGIQAYNQGMQYLLSQLNGRMFVSLSIAPLFPYQYGHSRRIACDAQASKISNTEYTMNSVAYGWWLDHVYAFNDPDMMNFGTGPDLYERQSRLVSGAITGLFLNGDSLTNATSISLAQQCLTNAAINGLARSGQTFQPVEGNTGSSAPDLLVQQSGAAWHVAVFNYSTNAVVRTVDLNRAGPGAASYLATDLWSGTVSAVTNAWSVSLNARQAKLFSLVPVLSPPTIAGITATKTTLSLQGGHGAPNGLYRVLASTNLAIPATAWSQVGTGAFDAGGAFNFAFTNNPVVPQQFYLLQVP